MIKSYFIGGTVMENKITYDDLKEHAHLFTLAPPFVLKVMAKKNSNLVIKFKSTIESHLDKLNDNQKSKLNILLNSDVDELQNLLRKAYIQTKMKQYEILSDPKNRDFIELNLDELRKLI